MSGGGGGSKVEASPVEREIAGRLKGQLFPAADQFFNRGTSGIFQGNRLAGQSEATLQAQRNVANLAPQFDRQTGQFIEGFNPLLSTETQSVEDIFNQVGGAQQGRSLEEILAASPDFEQTFLSNIGEENARSQGQISNLINLLGEQSGEQFRRNILPQIGDAAQAAGQFGGSRQGIAEGVAAGDVQRNLDLQIGGLLQQDLGRQDALREAGLNRAFAERSQDIGLGFQESRDISDRGFAGRQFDIGSLLGERSGQLDRALSASQLFPSLQQGQLTGTDLLDRLGGQLDQRGQLELEDFIHQQEGVRNAELRRLHEFQGLLGFSGPQQFTPETTPGAGPSRVQSAAGGALVGAGVGAQIGSTGGPVGAGAGAAIGAVAGLIL